MTDSSDIFGVGRIPDGPVLHLDLLSLLCFPHDIHENIHGALRRYLGIAVQDRHSQDDTHAILTSGLVLLENSMFTVKLGLSVQVCGAGGSIGLIRGVARLAWEHVIRRDVDQEDPPASTGPGERSGGFDIELSGPFRVLINFVWETVCRTYTEWLHE